jgi:hypothetical protein
MPPHHNPKRWRQIVHQRLWPDVGLGYRKMESLRALAIQSPQVGGVRYTRASLQQAGLIAWISPEPGVVHHKSVGIDASGAPGWERLNCSQIYPQKPLQAGGVQQDFCCGAGSHAVCARLRGWCSVSRNPTNCGGTLSSDRRGYSGGNFTAPPSNAACGRSYVSISNIDGGGIARLVLSPQCGSNICSGPRQ